VFRENPEKSFVKKPIRHHEKGIAFPSKLFLLANSKYAPA
jgi:hypothetical protein